MLKKGGVGMGFWEGIMIWVDLEKVGKKGNKVKNEGQRRNAAFGL
jgi:hypothetical protein